MLGKHHNDQRHKPAPLDIAKHDLFDDVIIERARLIENDSPVFRSNFWPCRAFESEHSFIFMLNISARIFGHVVLSSTPCCALPTASPRRDSVFST
jgi:hypothetical protein